MKEHTLEYINEQFSKHSQGDQGDTDFDLAKALKLITDQLIYLTERVEGNNQWIMAEIYRRAGDPDG